MRKPNKLFALKPLLVKEMNTPGFSSPLLYVPEDLTGSPVECEAQSGHVSKHVTCVPCQTPGVKDGQSIESQT